MSIFCRLYSRLKSLSWQCAVLLTIFSAHQRVEAQVTEQTVGIAGRDILTVIFGLALVIAVIVVAGLLLKRMGNISGAGSGAIKVVSVLSVGTKERIALLQVGEEQLLVGVTASQITPLHHLKEPIPEGSGGDGQSEFAKKLANFLPGKQA